MHLYILMYACIQLHVWLGCDISSTDCIIWLLWGLIHTPAKEHDLEWCCEDNECIWILLLASLHFVWYTFWDLLAVPGACTWLALICSRLSELMLVGSSWPVVPQHILETIYPYIVVTMYIKHVWNKQKTYQIPQFCNCSALLMYSNQKAYIICSCNCCCCST